MKKFTIIAATCVGLFYIGNYSSVEEESADTVVMNTVYIPTNDSDHSGNESIYNDPRMVVSSESNGTKVATCIGCHFKCNSCGE